RTEDRAEGKLHLAGLLHLLEYEQPAFLEFPPDPLTIAFLRHILACGAPDPRSEGQAVLQWGKFDGHRCVSPYAARFLSFPEQRRTIPREARLADRCGTQPNQAALR